MRAKRDPSLAVTFRFLLALAIGSVTLRAPAGAQEPNAEKVGPCTAPGWVRVVAGTSVDGSRVFTFTNVGPYPIFLHLASVVGSGNFSPRDFTHGLGRLNVGESRRLTQGTGPGLAYRYTYLNAAYLDFGNGLFTRCSEQQNDSVVMQLAELCREANAADSCIRQAERRIEELKARRSGRKPGNVGRRNPRFQEQESFSVGARTVAAMGGRQRPALLPRAKLGGF